MILADKIIDERKKNGWSQEDLADKLGVSRQSVSKWESAQSVPDLQRVLELSKLFGVSTDYLLKDSEVREAVDAVDSDETEVRRVTMEDANTFLSFNRMFAGKISLGALISILCPIPMIVMVALSKMGTLPLTEDRAGALGIVMLLAIVAVSLIFFIPAGIAASKWEWLEEDVFDSEYGVEGMLRDKAEKFNPTFIKSITGGTVIILLGVIALITGAVIDENNEPLCMLLLAGMMACIACGAFVIIHAGIIKDGFEKMLQEGDYTRENKSNKLLKIVTPVYWLVATAIYLGWSFLTNAWNTTWVVWPIAGVLFGGLAIVLKTVGAPKK
ncbi:MAG: helix-turn-helix transcriptional regulator [Clostridiales bacterium]|nr:helix-turn-helix transcriptional regulator [Clostridiales bacterium]